MSLQEELQRAFGASYTVARELSCCGMSRVFLADEVKLGRRVVIKVLPPELAEGLSAERFAREIRVAASLQQANIVPLLDAGEVIGLPYFTMPYVEGESLRGRLATTGRLSIRETMSILRDVVRALSYAHKHGFAHRDIKPDNILLSHGTAMVTDFGIAKAIVAAKEEGSLTREGQQATPRITFCRHQWYLLGWDIRDASALSPRSSLCSRWAGLARRQRVASAGHVGRRFPSCSDS